MSILVILFNFKLRNLRFGGCVAGSESQSLRVKGPGMSLGCQIPEPRSCKQCISALNWITGAVLTSHTRWIKQQKFFSLTSPETRSPLSRHQETHTHFIGSRGKSLLILPRPCWPQACLGWWQHHSFSASVFIWLASSYISLSSYGILLLCLFSSSDGNSRNAELLSILTQ